ncbi:hypothetical protein ABTW96_03775 [Nocardia beijingensis]|uniref:hypothetical protein n=1 Tax=Nocardia beijingensis TaxID=95162 RepID=UPI003320D73F
MGYQFTGGPRRTSKSVEQIAKIIKEVGQEKRFLGPIRRAGTSSSNYGPFAPQADDDPFATASRQANWRIGWRWGNSVTNSLGMTLNQGWQVIFEVFDDGGSRSVVAKIDGLSQRREVERFVDSVFKLI